MRRIISGTEIKKAERFMIKEAGIPSLVLMERAALAVAEEIEKASDKNTRITFVCGTGNNGADGIAAARILFGRGYVTKICVTGNIEKATEEFKTQMSIYRSLGGNVGSGAEDIDGDIIVDALFGIGLSRNIEGEFKDVIQKINGLRAKVVSVDVPSGINADTGQVMGIAVKACSTVTFGMKKTGLTFYPGADYAGKIRVADIGFAPVAFSNCELIKVPEDDDYSLIPARVRDSNKGTYGRILVIAGNDTMSGAAYMCAKAAFRAGAGMVKILTTSGNIMLLKKMLPEAIVDCYSENDYEEKLKESLNWCDTVAAGPGIGTGNLQTEIIANVLGSKLPCVVDADGINTLAKNPAVAAKLHRLAVITPHAGEMSRFAKQTIPDIKNDLISAAKNCAAAHGCVVVLKDARTVISDGKESFVNTSGNSGMATAGSGDVLTGIVAALLAKGMKPLAAAAMAAYIHGRAGDIAASRFSETAMSATDIIEALPEITRQFPQA